jgi:hypothetical protein
MEKGIEQERIYGKDEFTENSAHYLNITKDLKEFNDWRGKSNE